MCACQLHWRHGKGRERWDWVLGAGGVRSAFEPGGQAGAEGRWGGMRCDRGGEPTGPRDTRTGRRPAGRRPDGGRWGGRLAVRRPEVIERGRLRGARRPGRWGRGAPRTGPGTEGVSRGDWAARSPLVEPRRARAAFGAGGRG